MSSATNTYISTDKSKLDLPLIHQFLANSYWAKSIPMEVLRRSVEHSVCFGMYDRGQQIGFARLITDFATFAYLADVFIIETYQGAGKGKQLMQYIMDYAEEFNLRRILLATKDAHGLYHQFGFKPEEDPDLFLTIMRPDIYLS